MSPNGPHFYEVVQGYWRMASWDRTTQEHLTYVKQCLDLGVSTVDHAPVYKSEDIFGKVISTDKTIRDKIEIVSKCGIIPGDASNTVDHYDSSYNSIVSSVNKSLIDLNTDYIDTLLLHRPDYLMNADEVTKAFAELKNDGKVRYFGVSNFSESQFSLVQSSLHDSLVTNQLEFNPVNTQAIDNGTFDKLQISKVRPMAWSCLAGGSLFKSENEQCSRIIKVLHEIKEELNISSIEAVIYAWVRIHPSNPITIVGSSNIQRLKIAVDSIDIKLNTEQWYRVLEASNGFGVD